MRSSLLYAAFRCTSVFFCVSASLVAEELSEERLPTVIVSAHTFATPAEQVGSAVSVITEEKIRQSGKTHVLELLQEVPYLDVIQSGGPGGNASVFIRGANSEHTLVVLDGIELNDPSTTNRSFNFANLTLTNIERIEILRGPQSLMYGSDAIGGVIAIYTKKGAGDPSVTGTFEGGSYSTFNESVAASGKSGSVNYAVSASREDSESISAADEDDGNTERDAYGNTSVSARVGVEASEALRFNFISRYQRGDAEIDNSGGVGGDDPNREITSELSALRVESVITPLSGKSDHTLGVSFTDHSVEDDNDPDAAHPGELQRSDFDGSLLKFDVFNRLYAAEEFTVTLGASTEEEKASSYFFSDGAFGPFESILPEQQMRTSGVFGELLIEPIDWFNISSGLRWDENSEAGSELTYRVSPVVLVRETGTRFLGTIGTGFKAPSLYQLFSSFGNEQLEAEESFSWELGVEQSVCDDAVTFGATWFRNAIDNLITFDNQTFLFENISEAELQGIELFARTQITKRIGVGVDYSYTDTKDLGTQQSLLRRARNKFSAEIFSKFADEKAVVSLRTTAFSSRPDNDFSQFPATRSKIPGYALVDISGSYQLTPTLALTGRVDNILDKDYQEVLGFGTRGAAVYGGIRVTL